MGFNVIYVYGDSHNANYPKYGGVAAEYNVKQALTSIVNTAESDTLYAYFSPTTAQATVQVHLSCIFGIMEAEKTATTEHTQKRRMDLLLSRIHVD